MYNKNIIITETNVTKFTEDFLYDALDNFSEDESSYILIDSELTRRATIYNANQELEQQCLNLSLRELEEVTFKGMEHTARILGPELFDDYSICPITFTVTSSVAHDHQISSWDFNNLKEAESKVLFLVYWRVFSMYLRNPAPSISIILKKIRA